MGLRARVACVQVLPLGKRGEEGIADEHSSVINAYRFSLPYCLPVTVPGQPGAWPVSRCTVGVRPDSGARFGI